MQAGREDFRPTPALTSMTRWLRFTSPRPVRTTIVTGFTVPGMLIEIEATAGIPT